MWCYFCYFLRKQFQFTCCCILFAHILLHCSPIQLAETTVGEDSSGAAASLEKNNNMKTIISCNVVAFYFLLLLEGIGVFF